MSADRFMDQDFTRHQIRAKTPAPKDNTFRAPAGMVCPCCAMNPVTAQDRVRAKNNGSQVECDECYKDTLRAEAANAQG